MPNRLLREGICSSDAINALTSDEEVLFYRLLVTADDYGHADGRTAIVKSQCFPLRESATPARIETWLAGLVAKGMLARYRIDGRPYIAIAKWESRVRTHPKHPLPTEDSWEQPDSNLSAGCAQTADTCSQSAAYTHAGTRNARGGLGLGKGKGASSENGVEFDEGLGLLLVPNRISERWRSAFPATDVNAEVLKASAWVLANPKNRKSNYARFLQNWLTRAQDKAPKVNGQEHPAPTGKLL